MHNEIRLLSRLATSWNGAPVTLLNPPGAGAITSVTASEICSDDYAVHQACARHPGAPSCRFGIPDRPPVTQRVVLFLPRARARLTALLDLLRGVVQQPVELVLIGAKRSGIGGARKLLAHSAGPVYRIDAARHCQALGATLQPGPAAQIEDWLAWHRIVRAGGELAIAALPGVFASGRLDAGTALLLGVLEANGRDPGRRRALDFGCGAGVLAAVLARQGWQVDAVDSDYWALQAARATLQANDLPAAVRAVAGAGALDQRYELVVSNPPFHQGVEQDTGTAGALLARLPQLLQPGGEAWIVGNRFLPYEAAAGRAGLAVEQLGGDRGYKLMRLRAPG